VLCFDSRGQISFLNFGYPLLRCLVLIVVYQVNNNLPQKVTGLLGLLGIVVADLSGLVGVTCSPITVIGAGTTNCANQVVCCSNNSFVSVEYSFLLFHPLVFKSDAAPFLASGRARQPWMHPDQH
jgi:hypothetical protein